MRQSRRTFLRLAAGTVAGVAVSRDSYAFVFDWLHGDDPLYRLTGVAAGSADFERVGRAYLEQTPQEADRDVLMRALGFAGGERDPTTREELAEIVHASILRDVATDDLVQLRHWLFSRTEGRLFALGSLASD